MNVKREETQWINTTNTTQLSTLKKARKKYELRTRVHIDNINHVPAAKFIKPLQ